MPPKKPKPLPQTRQEAFVEAALYECFDGSELEKDELNKFFLGQGTVDTWCTSCQCMSTFHIRDRSNSYSAGQLTEIKLPYSGLITVDAVCGRGGIKNYEGCSSTFEVVFSKKDSEITKIGQNPSIADLEFSKLDEAFDKELPRAFRQELGKAIGLYSHGVGIGSFVYLRRILKH